jgi:hypothetical protein
MKVCPKCKRRSGDEQCDVCNIVFAEYEQRKREETGQVYKLISAGELEQAKDLAQVLSSEFPDSKGDFILLISNINRDLNIAGKYRQAQDLLNKGEHSEAVSLLRNLKAFDPGLSEKVIALRRRAERQIGNSSKFEQASELFEQKQYSQAKVLLLQISGGGGSGRKEEVDKLLSKIEEVKSGLLREVTDCLSRNLFNAAREHLSALISIFPEAEQECAPLFALIERRKEISAELAAAARKAKEEKRLLEAKVLYAFLLWQDQELRSSLLPHLEGIGSQPKISLADCGQSDVAAWAALGLQVTEQGFLKPVPTEQDGRADAQAAKIAPVLISLPSVADFACEEVNIDGEEVADFS